MHLVEEKVRKHADRVDITFQSARLRKQLVKRVTKRKNHSKGKPIILSVILGKQY